ncbi:2-phosphosulfolactate phosphatase [Kitasatospora sp. NPDC053057]|uniref:2-phosphosulfolactate phosphatase n=1 Tax=Kitasatospora sp. NPDC053057 TaxID=3364062 RepID=UPI0037C8F248
MHDYLLQADHGVRFDWGPAGARHLAPQTGALVVVDVLSFTTSVSVAAEAGTRVLPYPWRDESADAFATGHDARLAVGRHAVSDRTPWTLSPAALRRAPATARLVLPSPNGSAISAAAQHAGATVLAACLRNATAAAAWLAAHDYGTPQRPVAVIAAGEHWPDGTLRPALEDLYGAGAVIAALRGRGCGPLSPEAAMAGAAFAASAASAGVARQVRGSVSGRELTEGGFAEDVAVAVELDASAVVPVLVDGAFTAQRAPQA